MRMAPCRASIRLPFPTSPGKPGAPRDGGRGGHGAARGELPVGGCAACTQIHDEHVFRERLGVKESAFVHRPSALPVRSDEGSTARFNGAANGAFGRGR
jgi:hypothetical protein